MIKCIIKRNNAYYVFKNNKYIGYTFNFQRALNFLELPFINL